MTRAPWLEAMAKRWSTLQPRERLGLQVSVGLLGLYVLWALALAPALATLSDAETQRKRLEGQLQRMQALSDQASAIGGEVRPSAQDWRQELKASLSALGQAQLIESEGLLQVQVQACEAQALGRWLAELAPRWRLRISQASLDTDAQGLWQGQIKLVTP